MILKRGREIKVSLNAGKHRSNSVSLDKNGKLWFMLSVGREMNDF